MVVSSRCGSRQIRHWLSSETLKQISQNLTVSLTFLSMAARRMTSSGSAARMWKASRWALFGPIPGSRPSSSIRSWIGPSYMAAVRNGSEGKAGDAAAQTAGTAGDRAELLFLQLGGVRVGVADRGDDQVGERLHVVRVDRLRVDGERD